jgi:uncharacterized protein (UPF0147 family)
MSNVILESAVARNIRRIARASKYLIYSGKGEILG